MADDPKDKDKKTSAAPVTTADPTPPIKLPQPHVIPTPVTTTPQPIPPDKIQQQHLPVAPQPAPKPVSQSNPAQELFARMEKERQAEKQAEQELRTRKEHLKQIASEKITDEKARNLFLKDMDTFEQRYASSDSKNNRAERLIEISQTFAHIDNMLSAKSDVITDKLHEKKADSDAFVSQRAKELESKPWRCLVAEQFMRQAAQPSAIDQGPRAVCETETIQEREYRRDPASVANMLEEVTLTGTYKARAGGKEVNVANLVNNLLPDEDAQRFDMDRKMNGYPGADGKQHSDGSRSYASQLYDVTAINLVLQGKRLEYEQSAKVKGWLYDPKSKEDSDNPPPPDAYVKEVATGKLHPFKDALASGLTVKDSDCTNLNHWVIGGATIETGFIINGSQLPPNERNDKEAQCAYEWINRADGVRYIHTKEQLADSLLQVQNSGQWPPIIAMTTKGPPLNKDDGGSHALLVDKISSDGKKLGYDGTWGTDKDKLGPELISSGILGASAIRDAIEQRATEKAPFTFQGQNQKYWEWVKDNPTAEFNEWYFTNHRTDFETWHTQKPLKDVDEWFQKNHPVEYQDWSQKQHPMHQGAYKDLQPGSPEISTNVSNQLADWVFQKPSDNTVLASSPSNVTSTPDWVSASAIADAPIGASRPNEVGLKGQSERVLDNLIPNWVSDQASDADSNTTASVQANSQVQSSGNAGTDNSQVTNSTDSNQSATTTDNLTTATSPSQVSTDNATATPAGQPAAIANSQNPTDNNPSQLPANNTATSDPSQLQANNIATSDPSQLQANNTATSDPSQLQANNIATSDPSQFQANNIATSDPSQLQANNTATSDPSQLQANNIATSDPSQLQANNVATSDPSQLQANNVATSDPSQLQANNIATSDPSQPQANNIATSDPSQLQANNIATSDPSQLQANNTAASAPSQLQASNGENGGRALVAANSDMRADRQDNATHDQASTTNATSNSSDDDQHESNAGGSLC